MLLSSRVVSRSGTFVFFIGERHFGTLTAYVKGPEAERYQFTSALPTQVLKTLAPLLRQEINRAEHVGTTCAADAPVRSAGRARVAVRPQRDVKTAGSGAEALDTVPALRSDLPDVPVPEAGAEPRP